MSHIHRMFGALLLNNEWGIWQAIDQPRLSSGMELLPGLIPRVGTWSLDLRTVGLRVSTLAWFHGSLDIPIIKAAPPCCITSRLWSVCPEGCCIEAGTSYHELLLTWPKLGTPLDVLCQTFSSVCVRGHIMRTGRIIGWRSIELVTLVDFHVARCLERWDLLRLLEGFLSYVLMDHIVMTRGVNGANLIKGWALLIGRVLSRSRGEKLRFHYCFKLLFI